MNTKHTPGPWRVEVDEKGDVGVFADDYGLICYPVEDQYQENARLIAAAPDLDNFVREFVRGFATGARSGEWYIGEARALLARIDGGDHA